MAIQTVHGEHQIEAATITNAQIAAAAAIAYSKLNLTNSIVNADIVSVDTSKITTGILGSARGGTGNGFTKFTGPTTAEKTFTLPDANATILTTAAAVTPAQGGTGFDSSGVAKGGLLAGTAAGTWGVTAVGANGTVLTADSTAPGGVAWSTAGSGTVTGSGTTGTIPKWSSASALTDSIISESGTTLTVAATAVDVISNGGNPFVRIGDTTSDNVFLRWISATNYGSLQTQQGGVAAGNFVMQESGGNVGVGITPTKKFHVAVGATSDDIQITGKADNSVIGRLGYSNGSGTFLQLFKEDGTAQVTIRSYGASVFGAGGVNVGATTDPGTGNLNVVGSIVANGVLPSHKTSALTLAQDSPTTSQIRAYGADATTPGILHLLGLANDGSPQWDVFASASGLAWGGGAAIASSGNVALLNAANTFTSTSTQTLGGDITLGTGGDGYGIIYNGVRRVAFSNAGDISFSPNGTSYITIGPSLILQQFATSNSWVSDNIYYDGSFRYKANGAGSLLYFSAGGFLLNTAPSGTAGNGATMTTRVAVHASGGVSIGSTTDPGAAALVVGGTRQWFSSEASSISWWTTAASNAGSGIAADANNVYLRAANATALTASATLVRSTLNFTVDATNKVFLDGGSNTSIRESAADTIKIETGGTDRVQIDSSGITLLSGSTSINVPSNSVNASVINGDTINAGNGASYSGPLSGITNITIVNGIVTGIS